MEEYLISALGNAVFIPFSVKASCLHCVVLLLPGSAEEQYSAFPWRILFCSRGEDTGFLSGP